MPHVKEIKLRDVWRTCNKIRAAIFRIGLNLWDYFLRLDPQQNCLISESQFISVLSGQLSGTIGLSEQEISELADYFRVQDGRIYYSQLCAVIHDSVPDFSNNPQLIDGLEWEDPLHVNRLSKTEERRLHILMTKIATVKEMKKLVLRPYFQDYELVSKNTGTVTLTHFARILAHLGIILAADDFNLLVKKFIKDSYTVNYVAFLESIREIRDYMYNAGILDLGGDTLPQFPGRIISAELPKLPRPEIGKISAASIFGKQNIFHPVLGESPAAESLITIIHRIQRHVFGNRLRVADFFKDFDALNCGKITTTQFHRGLDALGVSGLDKLFLSLPEIEAVTIQYGDPCDPTRVCWRTFEDDIDQVFTTKELEKVPAKVVESPPRHIVDLPRKGAKVWQNVNIVSRDLCEEAVDKVKQKTMKRRILLKPIFRDFDKNNNGHVSRNQMRQALHSYGILLSDEELYALEERFNNDMGFNYFWFLREVDPKPIEDPLYTGFYEQSKKLNEEKPKRKATRQEKDIIKVLAKVKGKVVRERIRVIEFMREFDQHNEQCILEDNFKRGLSNCRFNLTEHEVETLIEVFGSPLRRGYVDYRRFCETVEEAFTQAGLEKAPRIVPIQHVPTIDCERNFLNFDERLLLSNAMKKLCKKPDLQMNLYSVMEDYDKTNCGTITKQHFLNALTLRGMNNLISQPEFDVICKCFSYERGMKNEVDYRAFMKALDILYATDKYNPF